jgi:streptogramin lyase
MTMDPRARCSLLSLLFVCTCAGPPPIVCAPDFADMNLPSSPDLADHVLRIGQGGVPFDPEGEGSLGVGVDEVGRLLLRPGQIGTGRTHFIWIANSAEGTLSKLDAATMKEIGRYFTFPGEKGDPSRTTVGLHGDVVVANRALQNPIEPRRASAVRIAADKSRCIDRNGNGEIDTFEGTGPVPAEFVWPEGQKVSPDECVLWLTDLSHPDVATAPRAAGFDAAFTEDGDLSPNVYIGLYTTREVVRLDGRTGAILKRISVAPLHPYGLVVDRDGSVWVRALNDGLARIDVRKGDEVRIWTSPEAKACAYGITTDRRGYIYSSGRNCVMRFDPENERWKHLDVLPPGMGGHLRGLAADGHGHLWIAETGRGLFHVDASGGEMRLVGQVKDLAGTEFIGAAIDTLGHPWVISQAHSTAYRVDPADHTARGVVVGAGPYTYSDMTGSQLAQVAPPVGIYRHTLASPCGGTTRWLAMAYQIDAPAGSSVAIMLRAAATRQALKDAPWRPLATVPPGSGPADLAVAPGNEVLQFELILRAMDPAVLPRAAWVSVRYRCGG